MKKLRFLAVIVTICIAAQACKCHQKVVVNATAHFEADEMWMLTGLNGKEATTIEGMKKISIQFNPEAGTFNGNSGCNRYFGQFKDLSDGKMELSNINATKMACSEPIHRIEGDYMSLLRRCDGYRLGEYSLELLQHDKVLLSFDKVVYEE